MILAAVVLGATISATPSSQIDLTRAFVRPAAVRTVREVRGLSCGIKVVGYRFIGQRGQKFTYAGDAYEIPAEGSIELIADGGRSSYSHSGKNLPLDVWPMDQFGFREVPLPAPAAN